jgi:hypothetical protein
LAVEADNSKSKLRAKGLHMARFLVRLGFIFIVSQQHGDANNLLFCDMINILLEYECRMRYGREIEGYFYFRKSNPSVESLK